MSSIRLNMKDSRMAYWSYEHERCNRFFKFCYIFGLIPQSRHPTERLIGSILTNNVYISTFFFYAAINFRPSFCCIGFTTSEANCLKFSCWIMDSITISLINMMPLYPNLSWIYLCIPRSIVECFFHQNIKIWV